MTSTEFRAWRKAMGWTQQQAADALGLADVRSIKYYEAGDRKVPKQIASHCRTLAELTPNPAAR